MARILIVEDEAIVAMELQERLVSLGYETPTVVTTGEDAVKSAGSSSPDLVLMDIRLGGPMDGIDAARRIRESLDVPVVYLTAHADDATLDRAKQTEPVGYLPKPFDETSLRLTLELALYRHTAQRQRQEAETARRQLEEQLMQARRMEAVGRLASGVAHDFNNMLSVVLGYAQMMERAIEADSVPRRDDARQIIDACQRAATLTRQLLIFSRKKKPATQVVNASQTVSALGPMLKRLIGEHIHLDIHSEPDLHTSIDPGHLEQIVMNLAVNARDAMVHGGALLIALRAEDGQVLVEVTDTGEGMSEAVREHIFEPFFTTKEAGRGTGLGLANVARVVDSVGGSVEVQSEPGRGTTVYVRLPRAAAGSMEGLRATRRWQPGGATVLLVEDDDQLRAVTQRVLDEAGHATLVARDAVDATRLLESHPRPVDLLLADVVLPGVGGPELAADLRRRHPQIRVLLMSGHQPGFISQWGAGSQPGLLAKPFSPAELLDAVAAALDTRDN